MNSASTSTASLLPSSSTSSSKKNYEQAFGSLSSSFGFAGSLVSAPRVDTSGSSSTSSRKQQTRSFFSSAEKQKPDLSRVAAQQQQAAYWASRSQKNFEAAYGDLASTYGFGGGVPSPKSRKAD